jgi:Transposase DDE domain group 1
MCAQCNQESFGFQPLGRRDVVARFDGGRISSDAGGLLLRETERITGIIGQFAGCFTDHRDPELIEHTVDDLIAQRVYGLALGYEDLNDHDDLRHDPLLAVLVGKNDPLGQTRSRGRDRGKALAGKSTLNRLELTPVRASAKSRYKKITLDRHKVQQVFTDVFIQSHKRPPRRIVLDLDATDDPIHGHQSGRFFHGYYKNYCYLPLYIFCGEHLLCARLRPSNIDASAGSVKELERIVEQIRKRWPTVQIVVRADSGFCRETIMAWCEANKVDFVLGLAKNKRLVEEIESELAQVKCQYDDTQRSARVFKDFDYQTLKSWSRSRRVIGKAEHLAKGANPRFVVTSLSAEAFDAQSLYEKEYCARGEMENRIKEQQLYLFADRTSAATMRANELRLWSSSIAYTLLNALRRLGLQDTSMAKARCDTIRLKLLKIGAQVRVTFRKVWVSMSESCPYRRIFRQVFDNLIGTRPIPLRC